MERNAFLRIAADLRRQIETGQLPVGRYLPTERELQDAYGASRSTIRRALASLIEGGWAENVPSKGVLASNGQRQMIASGNVALIQNNTYVQRMLVHRMGDGLRQRGLHLIPLGYEQFPIEDALEYALDQGFVGAIVWSYTGFPSRSRVAEVQRRMPIICVDHGLRGTQTDLATFDYFECGRQATLHLIRQGRKRIAVSGMMDMLDITHERFSGYMLAMFESGLVPSPIDYVFTHTSGNELPDPRLLAHRLSEPDAPDAILVLQDAFAPAAIEAARMAGRRVPDDLAIMTIGDDIDLSVDGIGMSAIALDWEAMADAALERFLKRLEDPSAPTVTVTAGHRLVVRGLCGSPSSEWSSVPETAPGPLGPLMVPRNRYVFNSSPMPSTGRAAPLRSDPTDSKKRTS